MTDVADPDLLLEQCCDRFRAAWVAVFEKAAPRPRLAEWLSDVPPALRDVTEALLLRVEWEVRDHSGDAPLVADYADHLPRHADLLRELASETTFDPHLVPGYRLLREIGRGGTGVVYLAEELDPTADPDRREAFRQVALQIVRADGADLTNLQANAEQAIRVASRMSHPRLVDVYHVGRVNGRLFFTMRYYPGGSLLDRIRDRTRPLAPREAVAICIEIAEAVAHMHAMCVVHLDIKPGNVLLDGDGHAFVTDFGLSQLLAPGRGASVGGRLAGTPQYMAPERLRHVASPRCDVYGIGATLYEMLTGRPPFQGSSDRETFRQIEEVPVPPPRQANPEVDRELERLCLKCLEKKPEHRQADAAELLHDLKHYLETGQGPKPLTFVEWFGRTMERKVHFEHGDIWSRITLFWAFYTLVGHTAMFGLLQAGLPGWGYWLWFAAFHTVGWLPIWVKLAFVPRPLDQTEWGVLMNWAGAVTADALLFALFCPFSGTPPPESVARVYPAWMVMHGLMWFMEARSYWGRFYLLGIAFFIAAALMPLAGVFAPLMFAAVNCAALLWLSYALRNAARVTAAQKRPRGAESPEFATAPDPLARM